MPDTAHAPTTDDALPVGSLISVSMEVRIPCAATFEQVEEWLSYEVGGVGSISMDNPLRSYGPEPWGSGSVEAEDTGMIGTSEEYGHETLPGGGRRYKVRHTRARRIP